MASDLPHSGDPSNNDEERPQRASQLQLHSPAHRVQYSEQDATEESASESELEGLAGHHQIVDAQEHRGHSVQEDTPSIHLLYSDSEGSSMEDSDISFLRTGFGTSAASLGCEGSDSSNLAAALRQQGHDDMQQSSGSRKKRPRLSLSQHQASEARKQKKHNHNERIRRKDLKDSVLRLRNQLQKRRTKRPTTIKVLEAAIQEITELKATEAEEERELEALKRTQNHLTWKLERLMSEHNAPSSPSSAPTILPRPSLPNPPVVVPPPFIAPPTAVPFSTGEPRPFLQSPLLFNRFTPFSTPPVSFSSSLQPGAGPLFFRSPHFPYSILPFTSPLIPSSPPHSCTDVRPPSPMNIMMPLYPGLYPSTGLSRFTTPPHFAFPLGALPPLQLSSSGITNQPLSSSSSLNQPTLPFHFSLSNSTSSGVSLTSSSRSQEESEDHPGDRGQSRSTDDEEVSGNHSELTHQYQHVEQRELAIENTRQEETGSPKNGIVSVEPFPPHLKRAAAAHTEFSVEENAAVQGSAEEETKKEDDVEIIETGREEKIDHTEQNFRPSLHKLDVGTITENSGSFGRNSISVIHHVSCSPSGGKTAYKKVAGSQKHSSKNEGPPPLVKIDSKKRGGVEKQQDRQETLMSEFLFENGQNLPTPPLLKRDRGRLEVENVSRSEHVALEQKNTHHRYSLNFNTKSCPPIRRQEKVQSLGWNSLATASL